MKNRHRAYAYIVNSERLLLFRHPEAPEAGIQVPAGTIEAGEEPATAVMREAHEETGLAGLELERFLIQDVRDMTAWGVSELQHRWFYHLSLPGTPPDHWMHGEFAPDGTLLHPFAFFWADVRSLPRLAAGSDDHIDRLLASMSTSAQ